MSNTGPGVVRPLVLLRTRLVETTGFLQGVVRLSPRVLRARGASFKSSLETNPKRNFRTGDEQSSGSNIKIGAEAGIRSSVKTRSTRQHEFSSSSPGKVSAPMSAKSPDRKTGGGSGFSPPHSMFPGWLIHEMESRQLASADPSTLERRREEAAEWIKKEVQNPIYRSSRWERTATVFPTGWSTDRWLRRTSLGTERMRARYIQVSLSVSRFRCRVECCREQSGSG